MTLVPQYENYRNMSARLYHPMCNKIKTHNIIAQRN